MEIVFKVLEAKRLNKIDGSQVARFLDRTPIFDWYMVM